MDQRVFLFRWYDELCTGMVGNGRMGRRTRLEANPATMLNLQRPSKVNVKCFGTV